MTPRIPLLLALVACSSGPGPGTGNDSGTTGPYTTGLAATLSQSEQVRAVWYIDWDQPAAGTGWIEYGLTEDLGQATPISPSATSHDIALLGLKPGRTYFARAVTELDDGIQLASDLLTIDTVLPPPEFEAPTLSVSEPGSQLATGFLQVSQIQKDGSTWMMVLDGEGDVVWWRKGRPGTMVVTSRPSINGTDLLYAEWDAAQMDEVGFLHRVAIDGRSASETLLDTGHHDFVEWGDGTLGFLGFEVDPVDKIATDRVLESEEGTALPGQTTTIWSWLDDYPQDPWVICDHMTAGWPQNPTFDEWTHTNSLMTDPSGEHYFLMSKFQDSLLKVNRASGELVWQLNGRYGDITTYGDSPWTAVGDTALFSHAHMSHLYEAPAGSGFDLCFAVFDNGLHRAPELSRALEVCVDEATMSAEITWVYEDPGAGVADLMGDVRKLDEGWLVGWSDLLRVDELDSEGAVVWSIDLDPETRAAGRVSYLPSLY